MGRLADRDPDLHTMTGPREPKPGCLWSSRVPVRSRPMVVDVRPIGPVRPGRGPGPNPISCSPAVGAPTRGGDHRRAEGGVVEWDAWRWEDRPRPVRSPAGFGN